MNRFALAFAVLTSILSLAAPARAAFCSYPEGVRFSSITVVRNGPFVDVGSHVIRTSCPFFRFFTRASTVGDGIQCPATSAQPDYVPSQMIFSFNGNTSDSSGKTNVTATYFRYAQIIGGISCGGATPDYITGVYGSQINGEIGTSDCGSVVDVDYGNGFSLANKSFTIEMWAERDGAGSGAEAVLFRMNSNDNGDDRDCLQIGVNTSGQAVFRLDCAGNNQEAALTGTINTLRDNFPHHLVFVYDAAAREQRIFVDGTLDASRGTSDHYKGNAAAGTLSIGRNTTGGDGVGAASGFNIDDLRVAYGAYSGARVRARFRGSNYFVEVNNNNDAGTGFTVPCTAGMNGWLEQGFFVGAGSHQPFQNGTGNNIHVRTFTQKENLCNDDFAFTMDDSALDTPPTPVLDTVAVDHIVWDWDLQIAPYDTDPTDGNQYGWAGDDDGGGRTTYTPTIDGVAVAAQTSERYHLGTGGVGPALVSNTRHCLKYTATYTDTGCSGTVVGPSASTPEVCRYTLAQTPANAPTVGNAVTGQSVVVGLDPAPNAVGTSMNVESNGTGVWTDVTGFLGVPPYARTVSGLAKSKRHFFRTRAINNDGFMTSESAVSTGSYVTMPNTPAGLTGVPAPLPSCAKTAIRWSWGPVTTGSGANTNYELETIGATPDCSSSAPNTFCEVSGLTPNASGVTVQGRVRAQDTGASFQYSDYTANANGNTASSEIPQVQGLSGASISPGVNWTWTAPPYLCTNWFYRIKFLHAPGLADVDLANNSTPQYIQVPMGVNTKSVIAVQAFDSIDNVTGSALSESATQYSEANPVSNLRATAISSDTLVLAWDANGNPNWTRFSVEISPDAGANYVPHRTLGDNYTVRQATITSLSPGASYRARVIAYNGAGGEPYGGQAAAAVTADFVMMTTAPVLSGTPNSSTQVTWSWTRVANADHYELRDAAGGAVLTTVGPPVPAPPPTLLSYTQTIGAGNPNTRLGAYVWAYNAAGAAITSATSYVYTDAAAPGAASWTGASSTTVSLSWGTNGNPNPGTFYEINVSTDPLFQVVVQTLGALQPSATVADLFPASQYYGRVRAYSGSGSLSAWTNIGGGTPLAQQTAASPAVTLSSSPFSVYVPEGNVLGHWHFDDRFGVSSTTDHSSNASHARLTCALTNCVSTPTFVNGMPTLSTAVAFGGETGAHAFVPYIPAYDAAGGRTLAAWVKPATTAQPAGTTLVVRESRADGMDFALDLDNDVVNGTRYRFKVGVSEVLAPASALTVGQWQRVVGIYDAVANTISIAVNGTIQNTTGGVAARVPRVDGHIVFGNRERSLGAGVYTYDKGFIGQLDEIKLVGGTWSATEVTDDYYGSFVSTLPLTGVNSGIVLNLPPNAFGGLATIYATRDPIANPIVIDRITLANGLANTPTGQVLVPNTLIEIVPAVGGLPFSGTLGSSATITMSYPDSDNDGLLDGVTPPLAAHTLKMYTLDTAVVRWTPLTTTVDRGARTVTGSTPHFSVFAVFGAATIGTSLSQVKIYPNPWRRGSRGKYDAPVLTFDNLPRSGRVRILTLAGEQVTELGFNSAAAGTLQWNGRNSGGRDVASGVYFAYVKGDDGSTAVIKFAIER